MKDREFLMWLHERLEFVHGEKPTADYMHKLRAIIRATPEKLETPNLNSCNSIEITSIEAFADKHGLVMEVRERNKPVGDPSRYYAHFKSAEAREGKCFLIGLFGDGRTPEEAIAEYARTISLRTLIIDAMTEERREIEVPRLSASIPAHAFSPL